MTTVDHNVFLNLRGLRFMDIASASTVVRAALSLPADRVLTVGNEHLKMVLELAGARQASQLRIQVSYGQP